MNKQTVIDESGETKSQQIEKVVPDTLSHGKTSEEQIETDCLSPSAEKRNKCSYFSWTFPSFFSLASNRKGKSLLLNIVI